MALSALVEYRRKAIATVVALLEEIKFGKPLGPNLHYSVMWKCEGHALRCWPAYWETIRDSVKSGSSTPTPNSVVNQPALYQLLRTFGETQGRDPKSIHSKGPLPCTACLGVRPEDVAVFCRALESEIQARIKKITLDLDKAFDKRVLDDDED
ncbi:hypothetical protein DENSPDRAFT_588376 [Dentipellis sp. KUC8613]|nr:hypothetical protein DENSPDRAFT_588376 [Dentipellis sp. KUC8613]